MRVILSGEHAMNCNLAVAWIESRAFVNCLRHELCLTAHWLQFNSWSDELHGNSASKSWRSQCVLSLTENTQWIATVLHELIQRIMNCSKLHELPYGHDIRCNSIHGGGGAPTRNHGEANSWCVSINSSIKQTEQEYKDFLLVLLLSFPLYKGLGLAQLVFD